MNGSLLRTRRIDKSVDQTLSRIVDDPLMRSGKARNVIDPAIFNPDSSPYCDNKKSRCLPLQKVNSRSIERTTQELIGIVRGDHITTLSCSSCMTKALALDTPHKADAKARVERKPRLRNLKRLSSVPVRKATSGRCRRRRRNRRFARLKGFVIALLLDITVCVDENEVRGLCHCARCRARSAYTQRRKNKDFSVESIPQGR